MVDDYHMAIEQLESPSKETTDTVHALLDQLLPTLGVLEVTACVLAEQKDHA